MANLVRATILAHGRRVALGSRSMIAPAVASGSSADACGALTRRWQSTKPNRPLSPHITVYKFGLNAITSVGHRGTGIFMTGALGCASMYLMATGQELSVYVEAMRETGWMLPIAKMAVAGPLVYHFMTGVRHIMWDNIIAHDLKTSQAMSYGIIGVAGLVTLAAGFTECEAKSE